MLARSHSPHAPKLRFTAADGVELVATVHQPAGRPRAIVLVSPGIGVPQRFFRRFAEHLAAGGLRVVTFDHRGIGLSRPRSLRGFPATLTDWAGDTRAALRLVDERWPDEPLLLVAHSFGGQLIGLVDELRRARAAILVGAQLGWMGHWPVASRALVHGLWRGLVPLVTAIAGYLPGALGSGEDLPAGVAREWARWCTHPEYLMGYHPGARARYARFDVPTVSYSFTDDWYAPEPAVRAIHRALSSAPLAHRRFAPGDLGLRAVGHFGFFRPDAEPLWAEARAWLQEAAAGDPPRLPSSSPGAITVDQAKIEADLAYGRD
jgi:predicted alpha/beta hydrolase